MEVLTIKEFATNNGFSSVASKVRKNTNGYPYITFITADNKAENIYFSKTAASTVSEGEEINKDMLSKLQVAFVMNADNEGRWKLISNSDRLDLMICCKDI